jgi:hypothetical protein
MKKPVATNLIGRTSWNPNPRSHDYIQKDIYYLDLFNIMARRLGVLIGLGIGILLIASAVIIFLFLGSSSLAYVFYRDSYITATTSSSIWIINMTTPPYNETTGIPSNLNIIYSTLAKHGVTNYTLAVLIRNGSYYYALFAVKTGNGEGYVGVFVRGNMAEVDDGLREILFNESITEKRAAMGSDEYIVDIIEYKLFNLTSPILKTYFPDATFFGGYVNYTEDFHIAGVLLASQSAFGDFIGEYGQWVELTYANDIYRTFVLWADNCANTNTNDHSPYYVHGFYAWNYASGSYYELLSCASTLEAWWAMQNGWTVNTIAKISYSSYYNKGVAPCGTCPAPP